VDPVLLAIRIRPHPCYEKKEPIPHWNQLKVVQIVWANMLAKRPIKQFKISGLIGGGGGY
jgi:hypothetical protein